MIRLAATKIIMVSIKEKNRNLNHNLKRYDLLDFVKTLTFSYIIYRIHFFVHKILLNKLT